MYLRVHYLSDVTGGWALGLAAFSLCGAVALIVDYLRQNYRGSPEAAAASRAAPPLLDSLTVTYIILAASGVVGFGCFAVLILAPAWTSYGRTWERFAAAVLSVFVLAAFAGAGIVHRPDPALLLGPNSGLFRDPGRAAALPVGHFPPTLPARMAEARTKDAANRARLASSAAALDALAESVESGAGLPETARCAAAACRRPSR